MKLLLTKTSTLTLQLALHLESMAEFPPTVRALIKFNQNTPTPPQPHQTIDESVKLAWSRVHAVSKTKKRSSSAGWMLMEWGSVPIGMLPGGCIPDLELDASFDNLEVLYARGGMYIPTQSVVTIESGMNLVIETKELEVKEEVVDDVVMEEAVCIF